MGFIPERLMMMMMMMSNVPGGVLPVRIWPGIIQVSRSWVNACHYYHSTNSWVTYPGMCNTVTCWVTLRHLDALCTEGGEGYDGTAKGLRPRVELAERSQDVLPLPSLFNL